ncbi:hypothetical protein EK21DRAFT_115504 [Setomelanomma holmii]|uniref:Rhodopsin domain-containing protein n=1 Tax=Setomelanomma holmii TaxID=210430 RepID=A0A9P4H1S5_9PLEO|nr:hypothetical protein EK21DRAFT_115504 [Setomelanomma holmii]
MAGNFIIEAWSELAIGIVFIFLRLYFRFTQTFYTIETIAAHMIVAVWLGMGNNNFTQEQRAALEPKSQLWRFAVYGSKTHIVGWFMYTGMMWTLKSCWTIYYSRMADGIQKMDIRIKVAWLLNGTTYLAAIILKACLDTKKKFSLVVLFSGGWIVIIFGILRCVTLVTVGPTEPSESGQWSVRESFVAILVSNAPMVFPLLKRWTYTTVVWERKRKDSAYKHPLSIPNDTAWGSDEAIVKTQQEEVGEEGSGQMRTTPESVGGAFARDRGSKSNGSGTGDGNGKGTNKVERGGTSFGDIVMMREWKVSEE